MHIRLILLFLGTMACTGGPPAGTDDTDDTEVIDTDDTEAVDTDVHPVERSCDTITTDYEATVAAAMACAVPEDCQVLTGQCDVGLGGCWEVVNDTLDQATLDGLGQEFTASGCTSGVCDCDVAPAVDCVDQVCVFVP